MTAPRALVVDGGTPCRGTVRTPGEKSISHRSVLLGALAEGTSVIRGLSDGADVAASLAAVEAITRAPGPRLSPAAGSFAGAPSTRSSRVLSSEFRS